MASPVGLANLRVTAMRFRVRVGRRADTHHRPNSALNSSYKLEPDDPVDPLHIVYLYKANSVYNRRFEQRKRLKELLGKRRRPLVETAKRRTKTLFLDLLIRDEADAIRRVLEIEPGEFWQAARGKRFLGLSPRLVQLEFDFEQ